MPTAYDAALHALSQEGSIPKTEVTEAIHSLGLDPEKPDPLTG